MVPFIEDFRKQAAELLYNSSDLKNITTNSFERLIFSNILLMDARLETLIYCNIYLEQYIFLETCLNVTNR